eukprot:COSAG02_NODE_8505_length_2544_cov_6.931697_2_plen_105_part_00
MLEVGRVEAPNGNQSYWLSWKCVLHSLVVLRALAVSSCTLTNVGAHSRAHFGAWCIVSSPLILGLELTDANLFPILDIIGNTEAIGVNQACKYYPISVDGRQLV